MIKTSQLQDSHELDWPAVIRVVDLAKLFADCELEHVKKSKHYQKIIGTIDAAYGVYGTRYFRRMDLV